MKTIKIIFYVLAFTALSCSGDEAETVKSNPASNKQNIEIIRTNNPIIARLKGTWIWEGSGGGIIGTIETPASTGLTKKLVFTSNAYLYYVNNVITAQGTYTIATKYCIHYGIYKPSIRFSGPIPMFQDQTIEVLNTNTLALSDDSFDGFGSSYIR